jgi:LEA14-like dessication related protein
MKIWLRLLLPAALLSTLPACKTKPIEYLHFENPRIVKMGFPKSVLGLDVTCYNPNRFGMRINDLKSDVFINHQYLGQAFLDTSLLVPKKDSFMLPVKMNVEMGSSLNSLMQLLNTKSDTATVLIKLEGRAKIRKGGVEIGYPIHYEERKLIRF